MTNFLTVNEHIIDRVVRVTLGLTLLAAATTGTVGAWGYIGVVPLITGLAGTCPIYTVFGISTCAVPRRRA